MKPLRIILEDFMAHRNTDIDCTQFKSVLVLGKDKNNSRKSNGIGKTSLFHGIEYALFGVAPMKTLDALVYDSADRCRVTFEFEATSGCYRVVRSRNKKTSKSDLRLYQLVNQDWKDITQKTSTETEEELHKIVKISLVAWKNSIVFGQENFYGLAGATPKERKLMLKEPLQIAIYNKYEAIAKKRALEVKSNLDSIQGAISSLGDPDAQISLLDHQIQNNYDTLRSLQETKNSMQKDVENVQQEINQLSQIEITDISQFEKQLSDCRKQISDLTSPIALIEKKIPALEQSIKNEKAAIENSENSLSKVDEKRRFLLEKKLREAVDINKDLDSLLEKEIQGKSYLSSLSKEIEKLSKKLPDGDTCEDCQQPIQPEYRNACESKRLQLLTENQSNFEKYQKLLSGLINKKNVLKQELTLLHSHQHDVKDCEHQFTQLQSSINYKKSLLEQYQASLVKDQDELKKMSLQLRSLKEAELSLIEIIKSASSSEIKSKLQSLKSLFSQKQKELQQLESLVSSTQMEIGVLNSKRSDRVLDKEKLSELTQKKNDLEEKYSILLKVQQAFGSSGIPTMIINTILDDLQVVANDLLSKIRPDIEIVFSVTKTRSDGQQEDTLDISYRHNGVEREWHQLSGGQKVLVSLSLKMGQSLVTQHRIGVDIKLLELDEVDAMLDDESKDALADVIRNWQDKFTIFVITHNDYLKDKFKHAILIESDGKNGANGKLVTQW